MLDVRDLISLDAAWWSGQNRSVRDTAIASLRGDGRVRKLSTRPVNRLRTRWTLYALPLVLSCGAHGWAQAPAPLTLENFDHRIWGLADGAPTPVFSIAQTPDGVFYVAGRSGLFRFDGISFERVPPPPGSTFKHAVPVRLRSLRSGELLIGYSSAGAAVLRNGRVVSLNMPSPPTTITQLLETDDRRVWVLFGGQSNRLSLLSKGGWIDAAARYRVVPGEIYDIVQAADRSIIISVKSGGSNTVIYRLAPGDTQFRKLFDLADHIKIAADGERRIWAFGWRENFLLLDGEGRTPVRVVHFPAVPNVRSVEAAFDRWGGIWGTTQINGIFRMPSKEGISLGTPPIEHLQRGERLGANGTWSVFADREGSIWMGTSAGLERFRKTAITEDHSIVPPDVNGLAVARSADGTVYITSSGALYRIRPGARSERIRTDLKDNSVVCPASGGGVWYVAGRSLRLLRNGRESSFPFPDKSLEAQTCGEGRGGRVWLVFARSIYSFDVHGWHVERRLPKGVELWDLTIGPEGDPWFSVGLKSVVHLADRGNVAYDAAFIGTGRIAGLVTEGGAVYVLGSDGIARIRDGVVKRIDGDSRPWAVARGLALASDGTTWLLSANGLTHLRTADFERSFEDASFLPKVGTFDATDGVADFTQPLGYRARQIVEGARGRIWFLRTGSPAYIDSGRISRNGLPPPVFITSVQAGGSVHPYANGLTFGGGTRAVDIAYTAYSMLKPERVRFRYRLEGVDDGWIEAKSRRLASYTNLGPGRYAFKVVAANEDGVWNQQGARLVFEIRPSLVQSWPFRAACLCALILLAWLLYSLRLRTLARRAGALMEERMAERDRIARELHDTLLQSVQGLVMRFDAVTRTMPPNSAEKRQLDRVLERAELVMAEGRERVHDLRTTSAEPGLAAAIERLIGRYEGLDAPGFEFRIIGRARPVSPGVVEETAKIVDEGIFNAIKHAEARTIVVALRYSWSALTVTIEDDGIGFEPKLIRDKQGRGHYGIAGMFERAGAISGRLSFPRTTKGTLVVLRVPRRTAFQKDRKPWRV